MKPAEYLDAAKTALELKSDYELARKAGINPANLYDAKHEKRLMPQALIELVANALKMDFGTVYLDLKRQRKSMTHTLNVSSPATEAAPLQGSTRHPIVIMSNVRQAISQIADLVHSTFGAGQPRFGFAGW